MTPRSTPKCPGYPGGPGSKFSGPCYNLIIVEQNFKGTFFDSMNGLVAHKAQRRRHTDATIAILVLDRISFSPFFVGGI